MTASLCDFKLPVSAVVMQLHQGDSSSAERQFFHQNVRPSLLNRIWELKHPSRFWVAYKVARKASMMVRIVPERTLYNCYL